MRIEVDHDKSFDWEVRHVGQLEPGSTSRPAPDMGPDMHLVRVSKGATTTRIHVPDEDIAGMHRDHLQGVADAAKGGWKHPITGEDVAARQVPAKSAKQLLAEHIESVLAHHVDGPITAVRVPSHPAFEAYLQARLVSGADAAAIDAELLGETPADAELAPVKAAKEPKK